MAAFPMTYTARATLEIGSGSGSVGSGRAVTTTTASNQVRPPTPHTAPHHTRWLCYRRPPPPTYGPPERLFSELYVPGKHRPDRNQQKLLSALKPKSNGGGTAPDVPRGPETREARRSEQAPANAQDGPIIKTSKKKKKKFQGDIKVPVTIANATSNCVNQSAISKKTTTTQVTAKPKPAFPTNTISHVQPKNVGDKTRIQVVNKTPNNKGSNPGTCPPPRSGYVPPNFEEQRNQIWPPPEESRSSLSNVNTVQNNKRSRNTPREGYHTKQPPVPLLAQPSFDRTSNNYRYSDHNYVEIDTRTCGPPEALFDRKTPKSRLQKPHYSCNVDYEFLKQFCDNSAFRITDPIISPRNNARGRGYTSIQYSPHMNAPFYSKNKRCDNKVPNKTETIKSVRLSANTSSLEYDPYQYRATSEDGQTTQKDFALDNRFNPRNVKFMTISDSDSSITFTDNHDSVDDESNGIDNATKDKDYESDCKALTPPDKHPTSADSICDDVVISHLQEHYGPGNDSSTVEEICLKINVSNDVGKNTTNYMETDTMILEINEIGPKTTERLEYVDEVIREYKVDTSQNKQVVEGLAFEEIKSVLEEEEVSHISNWKEIVDLNKNKVDSVKWTDQELDSKVPYLFENSEDTIIDSKNFDLNKNSSTCEDTEEIVRDNKTSNMQEETVLNNKPNTDLFKDGENFRGNFNAKVDKGIEIVDVSDNEIKETEDNIDNSHCELDDFKSFVPFETTHIQSNIKCYEMTTIKVTKPMEHKVKDEVDVGIELVDIPNTHNDKNEQQDNVKYFSDQVKLFETLEYFGNPISDSTSDNERTVLDKVQAGCDSSKESCEISIQESLSVVPANNGACISRDYKKVNSTDNTQDMKLTHINSNSSVGVSSGEQYLLAELSNNAYIFLTFPERLLTTNNSNDNSVTDKILEISTGNTSKEIRERNIQSSDQSSSRQSLRKLLFEKLLRDGVPVNRHQMPSSTDKVDSGIPFSCITSPEVVTSCNTTSSSQASLSTEQKQSRAVVSGYGGLPLSRPANYGATAVVAANEYKKSLDENGNSVAGASSPQSASSQNKKARKKKTSKNETVITSDQINGYQGNKDLKEVLRFIESNEEPGRGKLPRVHAKHKDEDDKNKKRSADRRRDTKHAPRASSLDDSRAGRRDLRGAGDLRGAVVVPRVAPPGRRSWGDDVYYSEPRQSPASSAAPESDAAAAAELLDFQTVTKKKKQRKRFDEAGAAAGGSLYRAAGRGGSPERRRKSAPPSDKSNDSNDDMDSVHSLPAAAGSQVGSQPGSQTGSQPPAPPAAASYADIARTRNALNNIPDLIESCNYYAEEPPPAVPGAPAIDSDSYPLLAARTPRKPTPPARPAAAAGAAPDVLGGRPAVVLLAAAGGAELVGVTFGFDVNEQLLAARRCDLVLGAARDAGLRYVPPAPPPAHYMDHLAAIVDYVGHAWEDIVKCGGGGKVRYFSE